MKFKHFETRILEELNKINTSLVPLNKFIILECGSDTDKAPTNVYDVVGAIDQKTGEMHFFPLDVLLPELQD